MLDSTARDSDSSCSRTAFGAELEGSGGVSGPPDPSAPPPSPPATAAASAAAVPDDEEDGVVES